MRELKFRAWIKEFKIMKEVSSMHLNTKKCTVTAKPGGFGRPDISFTFDEVELMQFTGVLDMDGTEIYEGDIVQCFAGLDTTDMVVLFEAGEFRMVPVSKISTYRTGWGYHAVDNFEKMVVGNIYIKEMFK